MLPYISSLLSLVLMLTVSSLVSAQDAPVSTWEPPPPKREFRAVWISTVMNIDYPKIPSPRRVAIKEQYRNLLTELRRVGFNAVVVQIRPAADALYPSQYAPWSAFLTGKQGRAPEPDDFDPLAFMIEETHRRGMEFHAWLNPYRASVNLDTTKLHAGHVFYKHRDWIITYGNRMYLNPAKPEVRRHLTDVVGEVVDNYDVDGIHFDDYFYPYKIKDMPFPDSADYYFYGQAYKQIDDWRRSNTDALIQSVSQRIRAVKPHVKFGISPFGVWSNRDRNLMGSDTRASVSSYDDLYADGLKWIKNGWIDYIAPQLYWNIGFEVADYKKLVDWWSLQVRDQHLYIGMAAYKVGDNPEPAWSDGGEIPRQIRLNRSNEHIDGSIFFSARSVMRNMLGLKDSLRTAFHYAALIPQMEGKEGRVPKPPRFRRVRSRDGDVKLKWRPHKDDSYIKPAYYVVYRFQGSRVGDYDDPRNILHTTSFLQGAKKMVYMDRTAEDGQTYTYVVAGVNRMHQEGRPSQVRPIMKLERRVKRVRPGKRIREKRERRKKANNKEKEAIPEFRF